MTMPDYPQPSNTFYSQPFVEKLQAEIKALRVDARRYKILRSRLEVTRNGAVPNCISMAHIRTDHRHRGDFRLIDAAIDELGSEYD